MTHSEIIAIVNGVTIVIWIYMFLYSKKQNWPLSEYIIGGFFVAGAIFWLVDQYVLQVTCVFSALGLILYRKTMNRNHHSS